MKIELDLVVLHLLLYQRSSRKRIELSRGNIYKIILETKGYLQIEHLTTH